MSYYARGAPPLRHVHPDDLAGWSDERHQGGPPPSQRSSMPPAGWRPPPDYPRRLPPIPPRDWMAPPPPHRRPYDPYLDRGPYGASGGYEPRFRPPPPPSGPWADRYRFMPPPPPHYPPPPPSYPSSGHPAAFYSADRADAMRMDSRDMSLDSMHEPPMHAQSQRPYPDEAKIETPYLEHTILDDGPIVSAIDASMRQARRANLPHFGLPQGARILCVADVRGRLSLLNELAEVTGASLIIHTGDFGFFDGGSVNRVADRMLLHIIQHSPLITNEERNELLADSADTIRRRLGPNLASRVSELPDFISGHKSFVCPIYATYGAVEDVAVLENFRLGRYRVNKLHILDEASSFVVELQGTRLRLLGLGGSLLRHKLFDNGEGELTIAGAGGTMWSTFLQLGELVETARRVYDPAEVRLLVTHVNPGRDALAAQLALALGADFSISASLHMPYPIVWNAFAVNGNLATWRDRLCASRDTVMKIWQKVRQEVESSIDNVQYGQLQAALSVANTLPPMNQDERILRDMWCINLPDANVGRMCLDILGSKMSMKFEADGMDFSSRRSLLAREHNDDVDAVVSVRPPKQTDESMSHTRMQSTTTFAISDRREHDAQDASSENKQPSHRAHQSIASLRDLPLMNGRHPPVLNERQVNGHDCEQSSAIVDAWHADSIGTKSINSITHNIYDARNESTVRSLEVHHEESLSYSPPARPSEPEQRSEEGRVAGHLLAAPTFVLPTFPESVAERTLTVHSIPARQLTPVPFPLRHSMATSVASPLPISVLMDDSGRQTPIQTLNSMQMTEHLQPGHLQPGHLQPEPIVPPARRGTPLDILKRRHTPVPKPSALSTAVSWAVDAPEFVPKSATFAPDAESQKEQLVTEAIATEEPESFLPTEVMSPAFHRNEETLDECPIHIQPSNVDDDTIAYSSETDAPSRDAPNKLAMIDVAAANASIEEPQYRVWFGGLYNDNVTEQDIVTFFGDLGQKAFLRLQRPFCFVDFEDESSVQLALTYIGRPLRSNVVKISRAGDHLKNPPTSLAPSASPFIPASTSMAPPGFWSNWNPENDYSGDLPRSAPWAAHVMSHVAPPQIIEIQKQPAIVTNPNTIWLGGFYNDTITEEEVREFFGPLVEHITRVKLMFDKATGKQRAFCFVEFDDPAYVDEGLKFSGKIMKNHIIKLNRAGQRDRATSISVISQYPTPQAFNYSANLNSISEEPVNAAYEMPSQMHREMYERHASPLQSADDTETMHTLWIGGFFNETVVEDDLRDFLQPISHEIANVKLMFDRKTGRQRPFCFVDFRSVEALEQALTYNGKMLKSVSVKMNRAGQKEDAIADGRGGASNPAVSMQEMPDGSQMHSWNEHAADDHEPLWAQSLDAQRAQSTIWAAAASAANDYTDNNGYQMPSWTEMQQGADGQAALLAGHGQEFYGAAWHEEDIQGYEDLQFVDQTNQGSVWAPPVSALEFPYEVSWEQAQANGHPEASRTLWIGGITNKPIEEEQFKEWFKGVEQVHFIHDRVTGQRRPFCYIDFESADHAADAMLFSGQLFNGNRLVMKPTETFDNDKRKANRGRRGTRRGRGQTFVEGEIQA